MKTTTPETPFAREIEKNIYAAIRKAKRDGTVAMSIDNLRQVTRTPGTYLQGAPCGTNAQWAYAQLFNEIVTGTPFFAQFINI